jgi:Mg-chelatase subunit ChlD
MRGPSVKRRRNGEAGAILIALALLLTLLLCFVALGTEAGRWFLLRAELSKSVDAAALAGAKNLSNPHVDPATLAQEFCAENFPSGAFGTPTSGAGSAAFDVQLVGQDKVRVDGHASAPAIMAQLVGIHEIPVSSAGVAQKRAVEIVLILDRSGSMRNKPIADLKVAAKRFLDYFAETQDRDKVGLISFATSVKVERPLGTNFVAPMKAAIDAMVSAGHTNPEDALDQADGPQGFTDQHGVPAESRVQQFVVFFSDGRPNTFRGLFKNRGTTYDAVAYCELNCDPGDQNDVHPYLWRPDREQQLPVPALPTGDGEGPPSRCGAAAVTTRWYILDAYPVPGYGPQDCRIPVTPLGNHVCDLASFLAVQHAQELKDAGVTVFAIGLGTRINTDFLGKLATGPELVYIAPTSDQLQAIFQRVAQDIKLRLVQ